MRRHQQRTSMKLELANLPLTVHHPRDYFICLCTGTFTKLARMFDYQKCLSEDLTVVLFESYVIACHFALCRDVRATHGLPSERPKCTVGVLAGTHWGDDSSKVMSHQSANPLWLCRAGGRTPDRGHDCHEDLSCGRRSYTRSSSRSV